MFCKLAGGLTWGQWLFISSFVSSSQRYGPLRPHSWSPILNSLVTAIFHHQPPQQEGSTPRLAKREPIFLTFRDDSRLAVPLTMTRERVQPYLREGLHTPVALMSNYVSFARGTAEAQQWWTVGDVGRMNITAHISFLWMTLFSSLLSFSHVGNSRF